ncbi:MAG: response regulator transcription factor [Anaerolineales bacterium]|nr:response regulator transcription factor [Chloroflexota bacterium]MBL6980337.1 response regulator transcription factor [Anaerolineales bacterium]
MQRKAKTKPRFDVILADREPQVRSALEVLFIDRVGIGQINEASNTNQVIACIAQSCPALLLIDWNLPGQALDSLMPVIKMICPKLYVVAISDWDGDCQHALMAGADAFICKYDPPDLLMAIVDDLLDNSASVRNRVAITYKE